MSEQTRIALRAARKCIQTDRAAMYACHFDYALRRVDDTGQMALAEYDAVLAQIDAALAAPAKLTDEQQLCQPNGLMFDALGQPRTRYVRVSLDRHHCVMRPSEGDTYIKDARDNGDESAYVVRDVYLSEREFDDLPEFDGF